MSGEFPRVTGPIGSSGITTMYEVQVDQGSQVLTAFVENGGDRHCFIMHDEPTVMRVTTDSGSRRLEIFPPISDEASLRAALGGFVAYASTISSQTPSPAVNA